MWSNPQETAYLVTLTEEILNGKPHVFVQCILGSTSGIDFKFGPRVLLGLIRYVMVRHDFALVT